MDKRVADIAWSDSELGSQLMRDRRLPTELIAGGTTESEWDNSLAQRMPANAFIRRMRYQSAVYTMLLLGPAIRVESLRQIGDSPSILAL